MWFQYPAAVASHVFNDSKLRSCQPDEYPRALHLASIHIDRQVPNLKQSGNFDCRGSVRSGTAEDRSNLRDNDASVGFELQTGVRTGRKNFCDQSRICWLEYCDNGHAFGTQFLNGEHRCRGPWIDEPGDCTELSRPRELQRTMFRVAFENGEPALVQGTDERKRVDIWGRHEQTTRERCVFVSSQAPSARDPPLRHSAIIG